LCRPDQGRKKGTIGRLAVLLSRFAELLRDALARRSHGQTEPILQRAFAAQIVFGERLSGVRIDAAERLERASGERCAELGVSQVLFGARHAGCGAFVIQIGGCAGGAPVVDVFLICLGRFDRFPRRVDERARAQELVIGLGHAATNVDRRRAILRRCALRKRRCGPVAMVARQIDDRHVELQERVQLIEGRYHQLLRRARQLRRHLVLVARVHATRRKGWRQAAERRVGLRRTLSLRCIAFPRVEVLRLGALEKRLERLRRPRAPRRLQERAQKPTYDRKSATSHTTRPLSV
jgi:hypothetical protein